MSEDAEPARLRAVILELLDRRGPGKTICPSDAARALAGTDFRSLMDAARAAAAELVEAGEIEVTQGGEVVDLARARGPIRLRRRDRRAAAAAADRPAAVGHNPVLQPSLPALGAMFGFPPAMARL